MKINQVIPLLRIFDEKKALEFYCDWLGFKVDWVHRFEENLPIYLQISKDEIILHLTEHHGDCSPGAKLFVDCEGIREYRAELISKDYAFNRPGLEDAPWNALTMEVTDPFSNRILFSEKKSG